MAALPEYKGVDANWIKQNYKDYLDANTDVRDVYGTQNNGMSEADYAAYHWNNYGQKEGRAVKNIDPAAYFAANDDVYQEYLKNPRGLNAQQFVNQHYAKWGVGENRNLLAAPKGGTTTGGTSTTTSKLDPSGTTSTTTNVSTGSGSVAADQFNPVANAQTINDTVNAIDVPNVQTVTAERPDATTMEVPYEQTTAGIMERLLMKGSPYIDQARTRALQSMNDRGLLSSSLAAGAGEEAAIGKSFDIGSRDAGIYGEQRIANMDALNTFARDNANRSFDAGKFNADASNDLGKTRYQSALNAATGTLDTKNDIAKMVVDDQLIRGRTLLGQDLDNLRAARDNAYKRGDMTLANSLAKDLDEFGVGIRAYVDDKRAARDNAYKQGDMRLANTLDKDLQTSMALLNRDIASGARREAADIASDFERLRVQLNTGQQERMAAINHNYGQLKQYSIGATNMLGQLNQAIASVLSSADIAQGNKQGLIDQYITTYTGSFEAMAAMYGIED